MTAGEQQRPLEAASHQTRAPTLDLSCVSRTTEFSADQSHSGPPPPAVGGGGGWRRRVEEEAGGGGYRRRLEEEAGAAVGSELPSRKVPCRRGGTVAA